MVRFFLLFLLTGILLASGLENFIAQAQRIDAPIANPENAEAVGQLRRDRQVERAPGDLQSAIARVRQMGLMGNYADGGFHAGRGLTRAELAVILDKTFGLQSRKPCASQPLFPSDVPANHWAARSIDAVLSRCIMSGYREGRFHPAHAVSRAEALAIFAQAYGVYQYGDETVEAVLSNYPDASRIPAWARKAMATALKSGFVDVAPQSPIRPLAPMTRGDMAVALSQYLRRLDRPETNHTN